MSQPHYPQYPGGADLSQPPMRASSTLSTVSLVLSLVGLLVFGLFAIGGVIAGHLALGKIKRGEAIGAGAAKAGLIIGYIAIALNLLVVVLFVTGALTWDDFTMGAGGN